MEAYNNAGGQLGPTIEQTKQISKHLLELQREIKEEEDEIFADINSLINDRSNLYSSSSFFDNEEEDDFEENGAISGGFMIINTSSSNTNNTTINSSTRLSTSPSLPPLSSPSSQLASSPQDLSTLSSSSTFQLHHHLHHHHHHQQQHRQQQQPITPPRATRASASTTVEATNQSLLRRPGELINDQINDDYLEQLKQQKQSDLRALSDRQVQLQRHHHHHHHHHHHNQDQQLLDLQQQPQKDDDYQKSQQQEQQYQDKSEQHEVDETKEEKLLLEHQQQRQQLQQHPNHEQTFQEALQQQQRDIQELTSNLPKPCVFFLEGNCRRSDCKFSHDLSSIICKYWIEGFCFKGDMCPFSHSLTSLNSGGHNGTNDPNGILDDEQRSHLSEKQLNPTFVIESEADFPSLPLDAPAALNNLLGDGIQLKASKQGTPSTRAIKNQILTSNPTLVFKTTKKKRKKG